MGEDSMNSDSDSMHTVLMDISKDTDKLLNYAKGEAMSKDNSALSYMMGANMNNANAMWMNNPFMYLIMLAMFGNGNWGGWGNRGYSGNAIDTNILLNAIQSGSATNQRDFDRMASNLGVTGQTLAQGIGNLNQSITQVAGQMGMNTQQVINAIQQGNGMVMGAVQNACCENRLAICEQTNTLQNTIIQQNELTRGILVSQNYESQIRDLTRENANLRDAAQTATLMNAIAGLNTAVAAQAQQIQSLQSRIGTTAGS